MRHGRSGARCARVWEPRCERAGALARAPARHTRAQPATPERGANRRRRVTTLSGDVHIAVARLAALWAIPAGAPVRSRAAKCVPVEHLHVTTQSHRCPRHDITIRAAVLASARVGANLKPRFARSHCSHMPKLHPHEKTHRWTRLTPTGDRHPHAGKHERQAGPKVAYACI